MKAWICSPYFVGRRFNTFLLAVILLLAAIAWSNRFVVDDAYISFRYARNLAEGKGLVWNTCERVEGYTNFLWTLLMGLPFWLCLDPRLFAWSCGLLAFAGTLLVSYHTVRLVVPSRWAGLLCVAFLGTNYTFMHFAVCGLETPLQAFFLISACYLFLRCRTRAWNLRALLMLGVVMAAALLVHPDSALIVLPISILVVYCVVRTHNPRGETLLLLSVFIFPAALLVSGWLVWKRVYYGSIVPNTFYTKALHASLRQGALYVASFCGSYLLFLYPLAGLGMLKKLFRKSGVAMLLVVSLVCLWCAYVIAVGGGFMEYRFMAPILPLLFVAITWVVWCGSQNVLLRVLLAGAVFCGSLNHYVAFGSSATSMRGIETVPKLAAHINDEKWDKIGRLLAAAFPAPDSVTIATPAAGAIPYYSHLTSVDLHGLNDAWIARHGQYLTTRPGHRKGPPLSYLLYRKVNLVVGSPVTKPAGPHIKHSFNFFMDTTLPSKAALLEIPVAPSRNLVLLYLVPDPDVDAAIERYNWKTTPLQAAGQQS